MNINYIKSQINNIFPWVSEYKKIIKLYKKSHTYYMKGNKILAYYYYYKISKRYNCYISPSAEIGENIKFPHPTGIVIGENVKIGNNCIIYQNVTLGRKYQDKPEYPIIGDDVIIYSNSTIVGKITIGNNSIIGCNTVVLSSIGSNVICHGVVKKV